MAKLTQENPVSFLEIAPIRRHSLSMRYFMIFSLLVLAACGGSSSSDRGMTPLPSKAFTGPPDEVLFDAVAKYVAANGRPAQTTYKHKRIDLNNDGLLDGIVYIDLPHQVWCGWDGCSMAVFQAGQKDFRAVAGMSGIRGPVYVLDTTTNGWRDIVVRISGMKVRDKNVLFAHNGVTYPQHPMNAPDYRGSLRSVRKETLFR
ncbi:MAG: hypothetical protein AAGB32_04705 [Pseudomonadota bacterium]